MNSQKNMEKIFLKGICNIFVNFILLFQMSRFVNTCVHNLNWSHFRALLRVPDENARLWYMNEVRNESWSVRTLDRNISTQYYYRLMQSPKKDAVMNEMSQKTAENQRNKFELLKVRLLQSFLASKMKILILKVIWNQLF